MTSHIWEWGKGVTTFVTLGGNRGECKKANFVGQRERVVLGQICISQFMNDPYNWGCPLWARMEWAQEYLSRVRIIIVFTWSR